MADPALSTGGNSGHDLRKTLHSAVIFVRSVEANRAMGTITLKHMVSEQIKFLKPKASRSIVDATGSSVGNRLSRWDRLDQLLRDTKGAVASVRAAGDDAGRLKQLGVYEADNVLLDAPSSSGVA
jgi:hypothetical protein